MDEKEFNKLDRKDKLSLIYYKALEIDNIYPWSGNLRIVTIYKLDEFLIELACVDRADKVSHLQRIKVSIAIIIADPFNSLG